MRRKTGITTQPRLLPAALPIQNGDALAFNALTIRQAAQVALLGRKSRAGIAPYFGRTI